MSQNVLYITIDSIRASHVGHLGYERPTTPRLDDLAERGTVCQRAVASGIPTFYSFKSLLAGVESLGYSSDIGVPADATTLAEAFRERGYRTAGFNAGNAWLTRAYGYDRGFDRFSDFITDDADESDSAFSGLLPLLQRAQSLVDGIDFVEDKAGLAARTAFSLVGKQPLEDAETVTKAAVDWLDRHESGSDDRPFFLWIHYMDPHYPWVPRAEDLDPFSEGQVSALEKGRLWHKVAYLNNATAGDPVSAAELSRITDLYDAEIYRTDTAIGRLLDRLETHGVHDETVVSVVGDHGTELQDHGGFSHGPRKLYEELIHVPLVFAGSGIPNRTVSGVTSLVDVAPTLLDIAADAPVPEEFVGHSIFERGRDRVVTEVVYDYQPVSGANADNDLLTSCTEWPWKLIVNRETGDEELYHLANDPGETADLSEDTEHRDRVESLRAAINANRRAVKRRNRTRAEVAHVRSTVASLKQAGEI